MKKTIIERKPGMDKHLNIVLAKTDETITPYVTWIENKSFGGFGSGHYFRTLGEAVRDFEKRQ